MGEEAQVKAEVEATYGRVLELWEGKGGGVLDEAAVFLAVPPSADPKRALAAL
eukprot:gene7383-33834_t